MYGIDQGSCQYCHVYEQEGLRDFVDTEFDTYQDLDLAYRNKSISVDRDNFNLCTQSIREANPVNPDFLSAYDPNFPDQFENIHKILNLDSACSEIYTEK